MELSLCIPNAMFAHTYLYGLTSTKCQQQHAAKGGWSASMEQGKVQGRDVVGRRCHYHRQQEQAAFVFGILFVSLRVLCRSSNIGPSSSDLINYIELLVLLHVLRNIRLVSSVLECLCYCFFYIIQISIKHRSPNLSTTFYLFRAFTNSIHTIQFK